jgi:hypothetical protein
MKVKFDFNVDAWIVGVVVEGRSYENALENLYQMTLGELLEEGSVRDFTLGDIGSTITEKTLKVKAYDIEYNIEEDNYESPEEYTQIINSLPTDLVLELNVEPEDDLEELIADEITYKTDWLVMNFKYMIIEEK